MTSDEVLISVGRVGRPFGIRGEIRIRPHNPLSETFEQVRGVWLDTKTEAKTYYRLVRVARHKAEFRATLEGVMTREQAEALRGLEVFVPEKDLPPLEDGEFYWYQLLGLEVWQGEQRKLGKLIRIDRVADDLDGTDVFVIQTDQDELLIPATQEAVEKVDLESGRLVLSDWFENR